MLATIGWTAVPTILITGAAGTIGTMLRSRLAAPGRTLRLLDTAELTAGAGEEAVRASVTDLAAMTEACRGADAVIHLAGIAWEAPWPQILEVNIHGTYVAFEAARRAGVPRVVFASSNHAVGMYEYEGAPEIYRFGSGVMIDATAPLRPDSLYGVSKAYGEALGRYFSEKFGLSVYCLRIGSIRADDDPRSQHVRANSAAWLPPMSEEQRLRRYAATWMSHADFARLVDACLRAEQVRFGIYFGVSDNPYRFWSIENARADLGWWPRDAAPPVDEGP